MISSPVVFDGSKLPAYFRTRAGGHWHIVVVYDRRNGVAIGLCGMMHWVQELITETPEGGQVCEKCVEAEEK